MRNRSYTDGSHPMQPLSPKRQPSIVCKNQLPVARSPKVAYTPPTKTTIPIEQELLLRQRIEARAAQRIEKHHEAVDNDRHVRKQRRQERGDIGKKVKALQEREMQKSGSLKHQN